MLQGMPGIDYCITKLYRVYYLAKITVFHILIADNSSLNNTFERETFYLLYPGLASYISGFSIPLIIFILIQEARKLSSDKANAVTASIRSRKIFNNKVKLFQNTYTGSAFLDFC